MTNFVAIIPAGGAGTRLWPLSRKAKPKFLLDLTGAGRTLIQATADRLAMADEILVVTGVAHADQVASQLGLEPGNIVVEPSPRDSMPAIGLAAAIAEHRFGPDTVVGSFAADHLIADTDAFETAVRAGIEAAKAGYLATIGITPTGPDTGFGYVRSVGPVDGIDGAFHVDEFLEKPDVETAKSYVASGAYVWNAGMFVATAGNLLDWLATYHPALAAGLRELAPVWGSGDHSEAWNELEKCVIDRAIAEPLAADGSVVVIPADMGWSDIGGYGPLGEHAEAVNHGAGEQVVVLDEAPGAQVYTHGKPIVVAGIDNAVIVDTGDVLLVTTSDNPRVGEIVKTLPNLGLEYLT